MAVSTDVILLFFTSLVYIIAFFVCDWSSFELALGNTMCHWKKKRWMWAENEPLQHLEKTTGSPTHYTSRSSAVILVHIVLQSLLLSIILFIVIKQQIFNKFRSCSATETHLRQPIKLPVHNFHVDVNARGGLKRTTGLSTSIHYSSKYSENMACHFMWSAIIWLSCCASWMPPLCNNDTYWLSKEYLGGKRVCELTCCNGGIPLQCHTWIQWAFQKDPCFYKCLPLLFLVKMYYWVNQQWDDTAIKPCGMAKHVLRFQT